MAAWEEGKVMLCDVVVAAGEIVIVPLVLPFISREPSPARVAVSLRETELFWIIFPVVPSKRASELSVAVTGPATSPPTASLVENREI